MKRTEIVKALQTDPSGSEILVKGWVKAFRSNRFIQLSDGSTIHTIQPVVDFEKFDEALIKRITTGAAVKHIR